jgi:L-rhamnose isomerase/sugar isomerase
VRPVVQDWRVARGLPAEPLKALAESGYVERITRERGSRNARSVSSYA